MTRSVPRPLGAPRWVALRDRRYLSVTAINGVMSLQFVTPSVVMPLWGLGHTQAPRWLISPILLINTVLIVLLQVRVARGKAEIGRWR